MRLVSVVQLYSCLIKRQHRAMDSYLLSLAAPPHASQHTELDQRGGNGCIWATDDELLVKDLRMEVQQRLDWLQQTLDI